MQNINKKIVPPPPRNKRFTLLVNPSCPSSHSFVSSTQPNFCSRSPELRPSGFTLAEVLITLVIIGVIAAITVPTLITKYQKEQTVTRLKKAYSSLSQTTNKAISDYGPILTWEIGTSDVFAEKYVVPYLNISRNCKFDNTSDSCKYQYYSLNNSNSVNPLALSYHFYLNDGTLVAVVITNLENVKYADIIVDINGQKKPNKLGKDVFLYRYLLYWPSNPVEVGKFIPPNFEKTREQLIDNETNGCNNTTGNGALCSTLIMKDSWQMKDDYPW